MNEDKNIEYYVLSMLDILGQKEKLIKLNKLKLSDEQTNIKSLFEETYGSIKKFRTHMTEAMGWLNEITTNNPNNTFGSNDIKVNSFSDLVTSYVSLRDDNDTLQFQGIYFLLMGNGLVFLQMLSENKPLRGGIDVGLGIKHNGDEIYGSALSNAYYLESTVAKSIRVVIGKTLYEYIDDVASDEITSNKATYYNIYWAKECLKLIKKDSDGDGEYILDYLSEKIQEMERFEGHYLNAKNFIESKMKEFTLSHQEKEYKKYESAFKYFNSIKRKEETK